MFAPLITLSKSFLCSALSSFSWYSCAAFLLLRLSVVSLCLCLCILRQLLACLHLFFSCHFLSVNTVPAVDLVVFLCQFSLHVCNYCVSCQFGCIYVVVVSLCLYLRCQLSVWLYLRRWLSLFVCIHCVSCDLVVFLCQLCLYVCIFCVSCQCYCIYVFGCLSLSVYCVSCCTWCFNSCTRLLTVSPGHLVSAVDLNAFVCQGLNLYLLLSLPVFACQLSLYAVPAVYLIVSVCPLSLKGIVPRDFWPSFFPIKLILLGPWFMGSNHFAEKFIFVKIFKFKN